MISVGVKNDLGKALSLWNGCSILQLNNAEQIVFNPIEEGLEQYHFIVAVFYKGITLIAKRRLELKSLKHSETRILIGNGYK
jgi:hypothetical protein